MCYHCEGIRDVQDWYSVTEKEFRRAGGGGLFHHYNSMYKMLRSIFPEYPA